jgi:PAS domain S-box-containing protein
MVTGIADREKTLQNRERAFREILDRIDLAAVSVDVDGRIQYMNPFFLRLSGYNLEEIQGSPLCDFLKLPSNACPFTKTIHNWATLPLERCTFVLKNKQERLIDWSVVQNLDTHGKVAGATGVGHDMTDLLDKQREIELSLKEKDILLKEVHHRVKNNLQIISSLLQLQKMAGSKDPELGEGELKALTDAANRVQSIALVHEILYDNDNFGSLDFRSYVESLCSSLDLNVRGKPIPIRYGINALSLDLTSAVPCALIVNEALTNVQKHAFPPEWPGDMEVLVTATQDEEGLVRLIIRDNGVGIPHTGDTTARADEAGTDNAQDHLGLTIMRLLVEQLGGRFSLRNDGGTVVTVEFIPKGTKRE